MSASGDVHLGRVGPVAAVTLRRPAKLNAITMAMTEQLGAHVESINADSAVRCVVLTGSGDRSFCVGSDVAELSEYARIWQYRNRTDYADLIRAIRVPVIAAVNGYAYGGGLELLLACDFAIAGQNATFAAPEIKLGWVGGAGQTHGLVHRIGTGNAARMLLSGDPIDAETALAWGLVTELVTPEALGDTVLALAGRLAERAPLAAEIAKRNVRFAVGHSAEVAIGYERDLQAFCLTTADAAEGKAAFTERRTPRFEGR